MADWQLQMNWQSNLLTKKRKNSPPLGFKNLGNTCYLNAVLQCLTYTPPLANFCLQLQHSVFCDSVGQQEKKSGCPFCLLEKRIVRSLSIDLTLDTPGKIIGGLKIFAEHFRLGRQEDAHEFLRYVIDACHTTSLRLKKLQQGHKLVTNGGGNSYGGSTVVKEIFGGALHSQVKCLACGNESNKVDEIMDISVDVLHSGSLKEAFQKFFRPEILDGNNKYKCDSCKKLVVARKQMSILQAPNILVIQLKRFEGMFGGKIDKPIALEEGLVLSSFMCKASQDPHPEYKLFATIVHSGFSPDSGHYYAYIKDATGRWYCCNDSYVSLSTLQEKADSAASSKIYKVTSSPQTKVGISRNFTTKKRPANVSMKIIVHDKENNGNNEDLKALNSKKTSEKKMPMLEDMNGLSQNRPVGDLISNGFKSNGTRNGMSIVGKRSDYQEMHNGGAKSHPDKSSYKRRVNEEQHLCSLFDEDLQSRAKREKLEKTLGKKASSFLQDCGWSDEVHSFMLAKMLSARDATNGASDSTALKRMLIADAKSNFIPRIPESLKADLIEHLRAFSQEKTHFDPREKTP